MKARKRDAIELAEISKRAFDHDANYGAPGPGGPPGYDSSEWQERMMQYGEYYRILLEGKIIGGLIIFRKGVRYYEIGRVFIDPQLQNQGWGTKVLDCLWEKYPLAKRWTLGTPLWNKRNQHFYQKNGFVKIGNDEFGGILYERTVKGSLGIDRF